MAGREEGLVMRLPLFGEGAGVPAVDDGVSAAEAVCADLVVNVERRHPALGPGPDVAGYGFG